MVHEEERGERVAAFRLGSVLGLGLELKGHSFVFMGLGPVELIFMGSLPRDTVVWLYTNTFSVTSERNVARSGNVVDISSAAATVRSFHQMSLRTEATTMA